MRIQRKEIIDLYFEAQINLISILMLKKWWDEKMGVEGEKKISLGKEDRLSWKKIKRTLILNVEAENPLLVMQSEAQSTQKGKKFWINMWKEKDFC